MAESLEERPGPILVKLGGSLITDKERRESVRSDVLTRIAVELAACRASWSGRGLIIGHGSGSYGHFAAAGTPLAATSLVRASADPGPLRTAVARTQDAAARLHRLVVAALLEAGLEPYSLAPSGWITIRGRELASLHLDPLEGALALGLVPVVHGDVAVDRDAGMAIVSTERVFEVLARGLRPAWVIWLGETDGILGAGGERIARVSAANLEAARSQTGGSGGVDVTGGMRLRLETAWELACAGVPSWIGDGREPGVLAAALRGEPAGGTLVERRAPAQGIESSGSP
ncbi:MAG TPA: isopentenyl phosphate kinase [Thermoanaerobaculia bacterium]|nr:isopentenyl phosphate kinase [Thermoanaerobaculia bacterium]